MILYSENDILKSIDFNETIQQFAKEKYLNYHSF